MSFPRYPVYKDSGVEWLGEVPAHWEIRPLKYITALRSGGTPSKGNLDFWDGSVPWASAKDLKRESLDDTEDHITGAAIAAGAAELVPADAVLVVVRGMILARTFPVSLTAVPMAINQDLKALVPFRDVRSAYLARALQAATQESTRRIDEAGHGTKALRMDAWTSLPLPVPSLEEQDAITAFLARETAKIDALIAEQERLIELLKEKRQAVISHAVTKGLDPDAPMKDSGVEWLGVVPAHWSVIRLGFLTTRIGSGKTPLGGAETYTDSGVLFIRSQNVYDEGLRLDEVAFISEEVDEEMAWSRVRPGDILLNITGASLGRTCLVPDALPKANVNQHVCVIRLSEPGLRNFVSAAMKSASTKAQIDATQNGAAREGLNFDQISKLWIALPPVRDKERISAHIETVAATTDALIFEAGHAVELLRERRAALISATVTGQIDVRSAVGEAV